KTSFTCLRSSSPNISNPGILYYYFINYSFKDTAQR
ncbi:MAG: hypothetical protein ACI93N_001890, partial [Flavobacteriaceae bacterium]